MWFAHHSTWLMRFRFIPIEINIICNIILKCYRINLFQKITTNAVDVIPTFSLTWFTTSRMRNDKNNSFNCWLSDRKNWFFGGRISVDNGEKSSICIGIIFNNTKVRHYTHTYTCNTHTYAYIWDDINFHYVNKQNTLIPRWYIYVCELWVYGCVYVWMYVCHFPSYYT